MGLAGVMTAVILVFVERSLRFLLLVPYIGIGTTTPASKLHVNGDIRVSGGSFIDDGVTLNAPDYVFEPSYKLMPLEELREFVTQEKMTCLRSTAPVRA